MLKLLHRLEDNVIKGLLVWITALVFFDVVLRFVFNMGFIWLQELTLYSAAWLVLIGASWAIRHGAHIGVSALVARLSDNKRRLTAIMAILLCLFYCGLFFYGSIIYLQKLHLIGIEMEDIAFPKWIVMLVLPISFVLISCRLLAILYAVLQGNSFGFTFNDEAKDSMENLESDIAKNNKRQP